VEVGGATTTAGRDAVGEHVHDVVEILTSELREGSSAAHELVERVFLPFFAAAGGDDLLRQDVEGRLRRRHQIEMPRRDTAQQRGTLHQLVPCKGIEAAGGKPAVKVSRAPHSLDEGGEAARRAELAHQLHRAHVDPQLEGGRRDQRLELAGAQAGFDTQATIPREAPVVGRNRLLAQALGQPVGHTLGHTPGIDEDQGRAPLLDMLRDALDHVPHLLSGDHGLELALGQLDGEVELALVAFVDDFAAGRAVLRAAIGAGPDEQPCDALDGALGCGEADAGGTALAQGVEALEGEGEVGAPLVPRHGVNLVDDHRLHAAQDRAALFGRDHQVERLGRGDQDVGWAAQHGRTLRGRRVAAAQCDPQLRRVPTLLPRDGANLRQGPFEVDVDVRRQSLEGGDVDDLDSR